MNPTNPDSRVADLVKSGKVKVGLFPAFFYRRLPTGELKGLAIELAKGLAAQIGAELVLLEYESPPGAMKALKAGECDVAFLGIDPLRAADVDFTAPYIKAEFSFLLPESSQVRSIQELDDANIRIAVVRNHAMESAMKGQFSKARLVHADTPDGAYDLFCNGKADVLAGIRPGLLNYTKRMPGSRALQDSYGVNVMALSVAKDRPERLEYLNDFLDYARTTGLISRAIEAAGLGGIQVI
jgi:polar amino acid transport system substrate-binding protein